jgi:uncharacterized SAM-binding protein YcdF (DUF218 family)
VVVGGAGLTNLHPLLLACLALAIWGLVRRKRGWIAGGLVAIFAISWPPLAWLTGRSLEARYSESPPATGDAEAIVVLSSGVLPAGGGRPAPVSDSETYERCSYAAWLYQHARQVPVLATGGPSPHVREPIALAMRRVLLGLGVPDSAIWVEGRSHSTYENALYSAEILRAKGIHRILLVTAAYHMQRSERCFRKQGFAVTPAPCGFHTLQFPADLLPDGGAILDHEHMLHEYVGLGWYAVKGRI